MKISYNWLQTFFDTPLPDAATLSEKLTFHSSEVEEVVDVGGDKVLDIKVLPDKSAWLLSHRGVAKEISTILDMPMARDPLGIGVAPELTPAPHDFSVSVHTPHCPRYSVAVIRGVKVGPSDETLRKKLEAIGQRPINNIVDATNYVMFHLGQPLHAFDKGKLEAKDGAYAIGVRMAHDGEKITTLSGDEYSLTKEDMVIIDGTSDMPIGIAGVKGGKAAEINTNTKDIIIESANFNRVAVRKTAQRLKLRTDASTRYENGVVPELAGYGLKEVVELILKTAGGTPAGYVDVYPERVTNTPVSVSLEKVNSVLGLSLSEENVTDVIRRFGYEHTFMEGILTIVPPFERDDLVIPEDLVEEIGRIYGLSHVPSIAPESVLLSEFNKQFFYAEQVREALVALGFSEVYTSSFREKDEVKLANALASDKGYLRSTLRENIADTLARNIQHKDLLGLSRIALFEIGTVFKSDGEYLSLTLGVRTDGEYNAKKDDSVIESAIATVSSIVGAEHFDIKEGISECDFSTAIADLPDPSSYLLFMKGEDVTYKPFSQYPSMSRDIALWVPEDTTVDEVKQVIKDELSKSKAVQIWDSALGFVQTAETEHIKGGSITVKEPFLFDEYKKDGRVSYAFRLVFQSYEKTLTDRETNEIMDLVTSAIGQHGWTVR